MTSMTSAVATPADQSTTRCGLAIFVKTPPLSAVKTRLAVDLGRTAAERLYLASAQAVASVAEQAQTYADIRAYWAVAEHAAVGTPQWPVFSHLAQGNGSLGERMATIYRTVREHHCAAILIGADAPQLSAQLLSKAAEWLAADTPRYVMGRACDGGFWLFGGNTAIAGSAWTRPKYSRPDTADRFVQSIAEIGQWLELDVLRDIDTVDDIAPTLHALHSLAAPTSEQLRLAQILDSVDYSPAVAS